MSSCRGQLQSSCCQGSAQLLLLPRYTQTWLFCPQVHGAGGEQAWQAVFTIMNEYTQIVAQYACQDKSLDGLADELEGLLQRYKDLGLEVSIKMVMSTSV